MKIYSNSILGEWEDRRATTDRDNEINFKLWFGKLTFVYGKSDGDRYDILNSDL